MHSELSTTILRRFTSTFIRILKTLQDVHGYGYTQMCSLKAMYTLATSNSRETGCNISHSPTGVPGYTLISKQVKCYNVSIKRKWCPGYATTQNRAEVENLILILSTAWILAPSKFHTKRCYK